MHVKITKKEFKTKWPQNYQNRKTKKCHSPIDVRSTDKKIKLHTLIFYFLCSIEKTNRIKIKKNHSTKLPKSLETCRFK